MKYLYLLILVFLGSNAIAMAPPVIEYYFNLGKDQSVSFPVNVGYYKIDVGYSIMQYVTCWFTKKNVVLTEVRYHVDGINIPLSEGNLQGSLTMANPATTMTGISNQRGQALITLRNVKIKKGHHVHLICTVQNPPNP